MLIIGLENTVVTIPLHFYPFFDIIGQLWIIT